MKRSIDKIIVHCTATPRGNDIGVDEIRRYHVDCLHWSDIGYHYIIRLDGTVETGRPEEIAGAHCAGHNRNSIGVAYVGGVEADNTPSDTRTDAQRSSLSRLLGKLSSHYPDAKIYSHRDFANKACPSFDATSEYRQIWRRIIPAVIVATILPSCRSVKSTDSSINEEQLKMRTIQRVEFQNIASASELTVDFDSIVASDSIRRVTMFNPRLRSTRKVDITSASAMSDSISSRSTLVVEQKSESQRSAGEASLLRLVYGLCIFAGGFALRHFIPCRQNSSR